MPSSPHCPPPTLSPLFHYLRVPGCLREPSCMEFPICPGGLSLCSYHGPCKAWRENSYSFPALRVSWVVEACISLAVFASWGGQIADEKFRRPIATATLVRWNVVVDACNCSTSADFVEKQAFSRKMAQLTSMEASKQCNDVTLEITCTWSVIMPSTSCRAVLAS